MALTGNSAKEEDGKELDHGYDFRYYYDDEGSGVVSGSVWCKFKYAYYAYECATPGRVGCKFKYDCAKLSAFSRFYVVDPAGSHEKISSTE